MKQYNKIVPEGFKDILFEECRVLRKIEKEISSILLKCGYQEVTTSHLEYYDTVTMEGASIAQHEMYKSTDNKGRIVVFRPDSTLPIARMVASRLQNIRRPIRLFYRQSVLRNRPDMSGRHDESKQVGIELVGAGGIRADLEIIMLAVKSMEKISDTFRIEIGHAGFFKAFAAGLKLSDGDLEEIREIIESKSYAALSDALRRLPENDAVRAMERLPRLFGGAQVLVQARELCTDSKTKEMLGYLKSLHTSLCEIGLEDKVILDLGLVQRNDYYTGMIFSIYAENCGRAVAVGGRYDALFEKFGYPMPAAGFAIDTDAAIASMAVVKERKCRPPILVHCDDGYEAQAVFVMQEGDGEYENSVFTTIYEAVEYAKESGIQEVLHIGAEIKRIEVLNYETT